MNSPRLRHRLLRPHPVTGKEILYSPCGTNLGVVGWSAQESFELLRELSQNDIERNLRREGIPLGDCIKIARGSKTWPRLS